MKVETIVDEIEHFVTTKLEQHEIRFDRLINAGQVVEARRHGAAADLAKSVLKFIQARRRAEGLYEPVD